jgi:hypothetical protein
MNKRLLSQLLDGAAFPAIMLAVAVSQINFGPHQITTLRKEKTLAGELLVGNRFQQKAK